MTEPVKYKAKTIGWFPQYVTGYYVKLYDPIYDSTTHRIYTGIADKEDGGLYPEWHEIDEKTLEIVEVEE